MAHVSSAVKEMYLDSLAVALAAEGLRALAFENRNFGASGGEPRQEIGPWAQVRDCRRAITCAQARPEADVDRIKVWGSSYGGDVLGLGRDRHDGEVYLLDDCGQEHPATVRVVPIRHRCP
jgi:predicted alpha/beta hydrolase